MISRVTKIGVYKSVSGFFPKVIYLSIFGECLQVKHSDVYGLNCFSFGLRSSASSDKTFYLYPHYKRRVKHCCNPLYSPVIKIQYAGDYIKILKEIRTVIHNINTPITKSTDLCFNLQRIEPIAKSTDLFFNLQRIEGTLSPTFVFSPIPWLCDNYPFLYNGVEFINDVKISCDFLLEDIKPFFRLWDKKYQVFSGSSIIQNALCFHHFNKSSLFIDRIKRLQCVWINSYD